MSYLKDVATILQVGFSGFAFLMAALSFRLLRAEASREGLPRSAILKAITRYTGYTFVLAMLVSASRFGEAWYTSRLKQDEQRMLIRSQEAQTCRAGLERLMTADVKVVTDRKILIHSIQQNVAGCATILRTLSERSSEGFTDNGL